MVETSGRLADLINWNFPFIPLNTPQGHRPYVVADHRWCIDTRRTTGGNGTTDLLGATAVTESPALVSLVWGCCVSLFLRLSFALKTVRGTAAGVLVQALRERGHGRRPARGQHRG